MTGSKIGLVVVSVLALQLSLASELRLGGVAANLLLLVAVAGGIAGGAQRGAVVGFAAGLAFDLFLLTPFGLSALAYCLAGYAVGSMQSSVLRAAWWIPVASAAGGSALGLGLFAVVGEVVGQDDLLTSELAAIMAVVCLVNALLALPAIRALRWALEDPSRNRMMISK